MTIISRAARCQPTIKRFGFEDGWRIFSHHFLGLGLPVVFVDTCLLDAPSLAGFESFGTRPPDSPLPPVPLTVSQLGNDVSLSTLGPGSRLVAHHWFLGALTPSLLAASPEIALMTGDSYALQLSWEALWRCQIGAAGVMQGRHSPHELSIDHGRWRRHPPRGRRLSAHS